MKAELEQSRQVLEDSLEREVTDLAYPNGNTDELVIKTARQTGHDVGFLFDHQLQPRHVSDPLRISRVRVDSTASLDRFIGIASGFLPSVHRARRRP